MALGGVGDYVLFYNKKDFAKAGISAPPTTWTQLEADAIKLSDPAKHHYGIYIPFGTDEWISYDWESAAVGQRRAVPELRRHQDRLRQPGRRRRADPCGQNLVRKDHAAPTTSYAQAGSYDGAPAFASDAVSMIVEGQWAVSEFNTAKVSYGVAELPAGTSGQSATNIGIGVATVFDHGSAATTRPRPRSCSGWPHPPGRLPDRVSGGLPSAPAQLSSRGQEGDPPPSRPTQVFATQLNTGHTRPTVPAYTAISLDLATEINDAP